MKDEDEYDETADVGASEDLPMEGEAAEEGDASGLAHERDRHLASWKRATADYQNLKRRLQSEIDAGIARQKEKLLGELLLVLDYLDMALSSPVTTKEGKNLHAGVEATRAALLAALEREGVRPVPETGRFDPAVHASVASDDTTDREPGEILATLRRGYTLDGRILRAAQVRVAGASAAPGSKTD